MVPLRPKVLKYGTYSKAQTPNPKPAKPYVVGSPGHGPETAAQEWHSTQAQKRCSSGRPWFRV